MQTTQHTMRQELEDFVMAQASSALTLTGREAWRAYEYAKIAISPICRDEAEFNAAIQSYCRLVKI